MAYCGYVVKVEKIRKHENADRLQIATFFGNDTVVGLDTQVGQMGIYFPVDGQLSAEFCAANDLVRRKDENGNPCGGYLDPDKRILRQLSCVVKSLMVFLCLLLVWLLLVRFLT